MSEDVSITHGGAIAVDTGQMREIATRLRVLSSRLAVIDESVSRARNLLWSHAAFHEVRSALGGIQRRTGDLAERARSAATGTSLMADAYELVELRAAHSAANASPDETARLSKRIDELQASDPRLSAMADNLVAEWERSRFAGFLLQADLGLPVTGGVTSLLARGLIQTALGAGVGTVPAGAALSGAADPVVVRAVKTSTPKAAPQSLEESLNRFPSADGAQVRVEEYLMPDGTSEFVVYVKGTQTGGFGGAEPWDNKSNVELYGNERSASYQATLDALAAAGAKPGDVVHALGHSQGGAIVARLAMESDFRVATAVTAGSPVAPTLGDEVLSVRLRHTDDPVAVLDGGGSPAGTGSAQSLLVQRVADPMPGIHDVLIPMHHLSTYAETAKIAEASGDVRMLAVSALWTRLGSATSITSTDYKAERQ